MYSWKSADDKVMLENGPFELRILKEPKSNPYECLPTKWRTWFEQERGFNLRAGAVSTSATSSSPSNNNSNNNNGGSSTAAANAPPLPAGNPPASKKDKEKKKWTFGRKNKK